MRNGLPAYQPRCAILSPSGIVLWEVSERALPFFAVLFAASWLLLVKALVDGGLGAQTGWIGWTAVLRGRRPDYGSLRTVGLFAHCRQPIYLSFALTLWTGPGWTADHLLIACTWTATLALVNRPDTKRAVLWGLSFGLCFLGRTDTALILVWLGLYVLVALPPVLRWRLLLPGTAVALVIVAPWLLWLVTA